MPRRRSFAVAILSKKRAARSPRTGAVEHNQIAGECKPLSKKPPNGKKQGRGAVTEISAPASGITARRLVLTPRHKDLYTGSWTRRTASPDTIYTERPRLFKMKLFTSCSPPIPSNKFVWLSSPPGGCWQETPYVVSYSGRDSLRRLLQWQRLLRLVSCCLTLASFSCWLGA